MQVDSTPVLQVVGLGNQLRPKPRLACLRNDLPGVRERMSAAAAKTDFAK